MFYLLSTALAAPNELHDRLLDRFHGTFAAAEQAPVCMTGLVKDLKENWELFTPAERAELTARLDPGRADLLAPVARPTAPPPPGGTPSDTCQGQEHSNRVTGSHFAVEWDNAIDERTAEEFLDALESAYTKEIDELGWEPPAGYAQYLMKVEVVSGNYAGAYTTVEQCGRTYVPYIVAYAGSFQGNSDWYETMALHEFNHSSQFSYGYGPEFWIWEATATYIEEQVEPDNNWWSTYVTGYSGNPHMPMSAESQSDYDTFYHMYGMAIWGFHLEEHEGDADTVRKMWEWAGGHGTYYDLDIEDMTEGAGVDFAAAYADFVARNAAMDYREHRLYMEVDTTDEVSSLPADGASGNRDAPGGYGQNYIHIDSSASDGGRTLQVTLTSDEGVDWLVELIEVDSDSVLRTKMATGEGEVTVEMPAFDGKDVMLAVSPLKHNNNKEYTYAWSAELLDEVITDPGDTTDTIDTDPDDGNPDGDGTGSFNSDPEGQGNGCSTAPGGVAGLGVLLGLAALAGRRRGA